MARLNLSTTTKKGKHIRVFSSLKNQYPLAYFEVFYSPPGHRPTDLIMVSNEFHGPWVGDLVLGRDHIDHRVEMQY